VSRGDYRKLYLENYRKVYDRMNPPPPPYDRMIHKERSGDGPRSLDRNPGAERRKGK
jgi:hypothetical protein